MPALAEPPATSVAWPRFTRLKPETLHHEHRDPDTRTACARSTPTGAPPIMYRSARSISMTILCSSDRLQLSDVKPLVVSHWGTTPGQNFIYVHLNRAINKYDLDMFYVAGPGHGGPADRRQCVPRRHVERGLSQCHAGRGRAQGAVQAILVSGRHIEPRRADHAGVDSRRRRTRVLPEPRVWRRLRQSRA